MINSQSRQPLLQVECGASRGAAECVVVDHTLTMALVQRGTVLLVQTPLKGLGDRSSVHPCATARIDGHEAHASTVYHGREVHAVRCLPRGDGHVCLATVAEDGWLLVAGTPFEDGRVAAGNPTAEGSRTVVAGNPKAEGSRTVAAGTPENVPSAPSDAQPTNNHPTKHTKTPHNTTPSLLPWCQHVGSGPEGTAMLCLDAQRLPCQRPAWLVVCGGDRKPARCGGWRTRAGE